MTLSTILHVEDHWVIFDSRDWSRHHCSRACGSYGLPMRRLFETDDRVGISLNVFMNSSLPSAPPSIVLPHTGRVALRRSFMRHPTFSSASSASRSGLCFPPRFSRPLPEINLCSIAHLAPLIIFRAKANQSIGRLTSPFCVARRCTISPSQNPQQDTITETRGAKVVAQGYTRRCLLELAPAYLDNMVKARSSIHTNLLLFCSSVSKEGSVEKGGTTMVLIVPKSIALSSTQFFFVGNYREWKQVSSCLRDPLNSGNRTTVDRGSRLHRLMPHAEDLFLVKSGRCSGRRSSVQPSANN